MRTILAVVVLSWAFLLLRLLDRPREKPAAEAASSRSFSMSCKYERTDAVGGPRAFTEKRTGSCFGPSGESVALAP